MSGCLFFVCARLSLENKEILEVKIQSFNNACKLEVVNKEIICQ